MSQEIVQAPNGQQVPVEYNVSQQVLRNANALPFVTRQLANLANAGVTVSRIFIEAQSEVSLAIRLYDQYNRYIREDVIPTVAVAKAFQDGRNALNSMDLDQDIYDEAYSDLERKRQRRRQENW